MTGPVVYIVTKNGVTKLSSTEWARHQQPRLRRIIGRFTRATPRHTGLTASLPTVTCGICGWVYACTGVTEALHAFTVHRATVHPEYEPDPKP